MSIKVNGDVNLNELLDQCARFVGEIQRTGITDTRPTASTRFVTVINNNQVIALYYHPSCNHYARAKGKTDTGRSYAPPGTWAYACAMRAFRGNQTNYGCE